MKRECQPFRIMILCLVLSFAMVTIPTHETKAFSPQVIQQGATGDDVIELQARLQYIGYYKGKIDGIFGWGTYWALRNFQEAYGLKIDGLAGATTKNKLVAASKYDESYVKKNIQQGNNFTYYGGVSLDKQSSPSKNSGTSNAGNTTNNAGKTTNNTGGNQSSGTSSGSTNTVKYTVNNLPEGYSANDIKLLSNAVYGESRGEPYEGQVAVAAVILNRVDSSLFPDTVSGVIFQPGAFTAVSDGQIWLTPNKTAEQAVMDAINGWDPSHGALYYFNPDTATSSWIWGRPQIDKIGKHIFCK
ncbi:N-acetylmuramoyl-L-alanine amidase [Pullulanibacillus pueri]|uniref:Spore cortex-lytic enzyme n=2 Tax=Pullulanibacillus pueri TaxID=1437324 RepID=A0A8J2ZV58_9BACL|nr:N-acetylmuramoyl-L-alanine amidase [Pullulanibacillus pueri]GGH79068.1 spore cortex-lytic enzyme [Pullulanibacillus pueri]